MVGVLWITFVGTMVKHFGIPIKNLDPLESFWKIQIAKRKYFLCNYPIKLKMKKKKKMLKRLSRVLNAATCQQIPFISVIHDWYEFNSPVTVCSNLSTDTFYEGWLINFESYTEEFKQGCLYSALLFIDYLQLCNQQPMSFGCFMSSGNMLNRTRDFCKMDKTAERAVIQYLHKKGLARKAIHADIVATLGKWLHLLP